MNALQIKSCILSYEVGGGGSGRCHGDPLTISNPHYTIQPPQYISGWAMEQDRRNNGQFNEDFTIALHTNLMMKQW